MSLHLKNFVWIMLLFTTLSLTAAPVLVDNPGDIENDPTTRPSVALVLGGGGAKGFAHLPVLELIDEMDIPIDMIIGTSIGAIAGGLYAVGMTPEEIVKHFDGMDWSHIFGSGAPSPYEDMLEDHSLNSNLLNITLGTDFSLKLGKGISNGQRVYQIMKDATLKYPSNIDFNDLETPFRAVATDTLTGEAYVLQDGDLAEAIRASMSLPGVFDPFEIENHNFMDGGLRYNLAINVAKNMGYDIIIAVDVSQKIRDDITIYDSNPSVAFMNTITISQQTTNKALHDEADLVIFPDVGDFGLLGFDKADKIYESGRVAAEVYKNELEELRKKIFPHDYDAEGNRISTTRQSPPRQSYSDKDYLVISDIEISGVLPNDRAFIENAAYDLLGKELNGKNYEMLMDRIYLTGNYSRIMPRLVSENGVNTLFVELEAMEPKSIQVVLGSNLYSSIAYEYSMTKFIFQPEVQLRGVLGRNSILGVKGSFINDLGVELFYFNSFTPNFFMELESKYYIEKFAPQLNTDAGVAFTRSYTVWSNELSIGIRTRNNHFFSVGGFHHYSDSSIYNGVNDYQLSNLIYATEQTIPKYADGFGDSLRHQNIVGFHLDSIFDNQDSALFATRGLYLNLKGKVLFPLGTFQGKPPAVIIEGFINETVPMGDHFALALDVSAGFDVTENLLKYPSFIPTEGFTSYDRIFFPHIVAKDFFGIHKMAAALTLQFKPFSSLTILGGDLFFRLTGAVGHIFYHWDDIVPVLNNQEDSWDTDTEWLPDSREGLLWNASLGVGIQIKSQFGLYIRAGAGSKHSNIGGNPVTPFLSFDFGTMDF